MARDAGPRPGSRAPLPLILLLAAVAAMAPALFLGRIPAATHLLGQFWPWVDPAKGPPGPVEGADSFLAYLPDRLQAVRSLRMGQLPLWDPWTSCGTPLLGAQTANALDPFILLFLVLPPGVAQALEYVALFLVAGTGMILLLRRQGLGSAPALLAAGLAFAFNPYFLYWLELRVFLAGLAPVPLALWALESVLAGEQPRRRGALLALAVGFAAAAGTLQTLGLLLLVLALRAAWAWLAPAAAPAPPGGARRLGPGLAAVAGWLAVGAALAALPLCAGGELYLSSTRAGSAGDLYARCNYLPWRALGLWFNPELFGWPPRWPWLGGALLHRTLQGSSGWGAAGVLPLGLALFALARGAGPRRERIFWAALAGIPLLLLLAMATPLHALARALYRGLDEVDLLRGLFLVNLALAVLAGWGADALLALWRALARDGRAWLLPLGAFAALGVMLLALARVGVASPRPFWLDLLPPCGTLAALALLGWSARGGPAARRAAPWGLGVLIALELGALHFRVNEFPPLETLYPGHPAIAELRRQLGPPEWHRLLVPASERAFPPNTPALFGLADVRGYSNMPIRRFRLLLEAAEGRTMLNQTLIYRVQSPIYRLLGAEYVFQLRLPGEGDSLFQRTALPEFAPAVFRRRDTLPRAFLVHAIETVEGEAAMRARLADPAFDPAAVVYLARADGPAPPVAPARGPEMAQVRVLTPLRVEAVARVSAPALLVVSDAWYPGWRVHVDGAPGRILAADWGLRGVALGPGRHEIVFTYRPAWLWPAQGATLLGLMIVAWGLVARRRAPTAAAVESAG